MTRPVCRRCGSIGLMKGVISLSCPICGECVYVPDVDDRLLWMEHRLGLLFKRDGWRWLGEFEPPAWFMENVV